MSRVILGILFTLSASAQTPSVMVQIVEEPNVSVNHKIVPAGRDEVAIRHHALRDGLFTDFTVYGERDPQSGHLLVTVRPGD
jgi:hypothetical protein